MIAPRLAPLLALLLAACGTAPATAAPALLLKNMIGKVVEGGSYARITLDNCRDCRIIGATLTPPPAANINEAAVRVVNSPGARIERLRITGQPATTGVAQSAPGPAGNVIGLPSGEGIHIERSPGAVLRGNSITGFHQGITFGPMAGLTIADNTITSVRTTFIAGEPGPGLRITGNVMAGAHPWRWGQTPAGDHADVIHLWARVPVPGVVVSDNYFDQADGVAILGIVLQAKGGSFPGAEVSRNTVALGQGQAIVLRSVGGSAIGNQLVPLGTGKAAARLDVYGPLPGPLLVAATRGGPVAVDRKMSAADRAKLTVQP